MLRTLLKTFIIALSFCWSLTARAQTVLPDFTGLIESLMPTVVNITIDIDTNSSEYEDIEFSIDNIPSKITSGSGFIISKDGLIITNKHVVDSAKDIKVTTHNGDSFDAEIVGVDDKTDLALLKIRTENDWITANLGDSDNIKVGEWVIAIGNPFGLGSSVTKGIISAKSRDIDSGNYDNFIQTDAAINRGNSGGPLFNMSGEVIGINSAMFSTTGANMGIGFAIPINQAKWVVAQLKEHGKVKRGWIGIKMQPNLSIIPNDSNKKQNIGIIVTDLTPNAPAQKAGLKAGDVIVKFDDIEIENTKNLSRIIAETQIGKISTMKIYRAGKMLDIKVTIGEMPPEKKEKELISRVIEDSIKPIPELGINITESKYGMIISGVDQNHDAGKKGIIVGDIIIKADNKNVFSVEDIRNALNEAKLENNRPVVLQIQSDGTTHFVTVEIK